MKRWLPWTCVRHSKNSASKSWVAEHNEADHGIVAGLSENGNLSCGVRVERIPFSVLSGLNSLGVADGIVPRARFVGVNGNGSLSSGQRTLKQWFNTAEFANPGAQRWRNSGRNILEGPGTKDIDFSVFKTTPLHEAANLQLRAEFFNLFNTPQFNNPTATVGPDFSTISSAGSPNTLQRVSREIQLAAKVSF